MTSRTTGFSASFTVLATLALCGPVHAGSPDVMITDAKIAAGRLVITGKAATAGMKLRLDGKTQAAFNTVSRYDKSFSLSAVYLPRDCIVSVQKVLPSGQLGDAHEAVIANCAPSAITPRGTWSAATAYQMTDVVAFRGASWLAAQDNVNERPGVGASWQLFAAGGELGKIGLSGTAKAPEPDAAPQSPLRASPASPSDTSARGIPSGDAGGDLDGTYPNPDIRNQAVTQDKIAPLAVSGGKIKDAAVTGVKIAVDAITSDKVLDDTQPGGGLTSADLAPDSVTATEIADNSIDSGEIVNNSLFGSDIADGSITTTDIADGTITSADIASNSIGAGDIENNTLTSSDFAGGAATGSVSFGAGAVPNGRCIRVNIGISGATAGDVPIVAWRGDVQNGVFLYGTRVVSANIAEVGICNFSGTTMAAINNIPIRLITLR